MRISTLGRVPRHIRRRRQRCRRASPGIPQRIPALAEPITTTRSAIGNGDRPASSPRNDTTKGVRTGVCVDRAPAERPAPTGNLRRARKTTSRWTYSHREYRRTSSANDQNRWTLTAFPLATTSGSPHVRCRLPDLIATVQDRRSAGNASTDGRPEPATRDLTWSDINPCAGANGDPPSGPDNVAEDDVGRAPVPGRRRHMTNPCPTPGDEPGRVQRGQRR